MTDVRANADIGRGTATLSLPCTSATTLPIHSTTGTEMDAMAAEPVPGPRRGQEGEQAMEDKGKERNRGDEAGKQEGMVQAAPEVEKPNALLTPESRMAQMKAKRTAALESRIQTLNAEIARMTEKLESVRGDLRSPPTATPHEIVKSHIALLHAYNEIRDVGQCLMGLVADNRNVRAREVYAEFGVGLAD